MSRIASAMVLINRGTPRLSRWMMALTSGGNSIGFPIEAFISLTVRQADLPAITAELAASVIEPAGVGEGLALVLLAKVEMGVQLEEHGVWVDALDAAVGRLRLRLHVAVEHQ